ncbi:MAG: RICIN domain-containing protein [Frankiaceae bacterium]
MITNQVLHRPSGKHSLVRIVLALVLVLVAVGAAQGVAQAGPAPGYYQVVNRQTNECLEVSGASAFHAANVDVSRCIGEDHQQWHPRYVGNGFYELRVRHTTCA